MSYLLNINYQAENVYTNTFDTEVEAQDFAKTFVDKRVKELPENSQAWALSVYSTVITPVEKTLLPNYNL